MSLKKLNAAIITHKIGFWAYDTVLACKDLKVQAFKDTNSLLPISINPYLLPEATDFDVIYIGSHTWRHCFPELEQQVKVVDLLRKKTDRLVMVDGWD